MAIKQTEYIKFGENLYEIIPPLPSSTERGGIIASPKESTDTVEIKLGGDGKLYAPAYPDLSNIDTSAIQAKIDELTNKIENKADEVHTHVISDVTDLQVELDKKANLSDVPTLFIQGTSTIFGDDFLLEEHVATLSDDEQGNIKMRCSASSAVTVEDDDNGNVRLTI